MHAPTLDGRYRIVREIARGGMGVVYLVEHTVTGKRHAAKVLMSPIAAHPGMVERFRREARSAARIGSRHVVDVSDAGSAPEMSGAPFLVMELLSGLDLSHLVAQRGALRPDEAIAILAPICRVLDRAHAMGIVHRDLKPANLYLHRDDDGRATVKVLDFGLATAVRDAMEDRAVTASGDVMGTPAYMAPEQAAGHHHAVGPGTDIWAIGLIAFELISGQCYWGNASTGQVFAGLIGRQMHVPSQLAPHLGPGFDQWFARACQWDPRGRFSRATEQLEALAGVFGVAVPSADTPLPASLLHDVEAAYLAEPSPDTSRGPTVAAPLAPPGRAPSPGLTPGHGPALALEPLPPAGTAAPVIVASPSGGPPRRTGPSWPLMSLIGGSVSIAVGLVLLWWSLGPRAEDDGPRTRKKARVEVEDDVPSPSPVVDSDDEGDPGHVDLPSLLWTPAGLHDAIQKMGRSQLVEVNVHPEFALVQVENPKSPPKGNRTVLSYEFAGTMARTPKEKGWYQSHAPAEGAFPTSVIDVRQLPKMLAHIKTMTNKPVTHAIFFRPIPFGRDPVWNIHTVSAYYEFTPEGTFRRRIVF